MTTSTPSTSPQAIWLKDYAPPNHLVPEVRLFFDLGEDETRVRASLKIVANPEGESGAPLLLNGGKQELLSLHLDGVQLGEECYRRDLEGETLTIFDVPDEFTLQLETRLFPGKNTSLEGLYRSGSLFSTQCEAQGFRKIIFFPDRPDVMSKFTVTIAADPAACPVMLSNGNQTAHSGYPDGRHWVTWEDPFPKPAYLFALVAGDLKGIQDSFKTASGREVTLRIFTEPHNIDKCDHAMVSLRRSMVWDEQTYGREYDLDIFNIVAVDDFNSGAMENKSLNIFNSKFVLARPETATDLDYLNIEAVIGHEYFHNWTGNRITCRDWFQLSLKEGLTVFRDQEFTADHNSRAIKRIQDVRLLRSVQFAEDMGPMSHPVRPDHYIEIRNFYTVTVYEKGAEVVRMQHTLLGEDQYRKGMDLYFERHDGEAVTVEDFVRCMEEASGRNLDQFMNWYNQRGTPLLHAGWEHDRATDTLVLTLTQSPPESLGAEERAQWQPHHIPVAVGVLDGESGEELLPEGSRLLELRELSESFSFEGVTVEAIPSILRGFSAPVLLETDHSREEKLFLMAHDSDPFNRWEAGQQIAESLLLRWIEDYRSETAIEQPRHPRVGGDLEAGLHSQEVLPEMDESWLDAVGKVLDSALEDPALTTEVLILPTERWLAERMELVDVKAIHTARESAIGAIAERYREQMVALYHQMHGDDAAGRTLRNQLLGMLMRLGDGEIVSLATVQLEQAENMSDEIGALSALEMVDIPERQSALDHFYSKWSGERLVVDKWFALQAGSQLPATMDRVEELLDHPDFEIINPNRVRSLVGAFAHGNQLHFHDVDGRGYRFLADQVMRLDPLNSQVAARMVGAFNQWRRFDKDRQGLMQQQLQRIADTDGLSRDVYEIVMGSGLRI